MLIYLAGPMTSIPGFNFPAFHAHAARLRGCGHEVINPAELDHGDTSKDWAEYLKRDLVQMLRCDAVAVLPGWSDSKGAQLETHVARMVDIPVLDVATLQPFAESVLEEAQRLVYGAREESYGHPAEDLTRTGRLWAPILGLEIVEAWQVALCMVELKVSREVNQHGRDNLVDMAGYTAVLQRINERMPR